ncbi:MAG: NAD(P)/FAD-dependent oxidoreductase [Nitrospirae bacterium]|nr:MAG: NAD(P)/FAD-dependent oxidoreductase [Nitrospirota bacterium]
MRYVIIGNGVAGTTAAAAIRKADQDGSITMISREEQPFYTRIRLPEVLSGGLESDALILHKEAWYQQQNIGLLLATAVEEIRPDRHEITTSSQSILTYDRLLLATGARPFLPPVPGIGKTGVMSLRTLGNAVSLKAFLDGPGKQVVLIGGGVLGLEAGHHLIKAGHAVTVVESLPRLLPRQMDDEGAALLRKQLESLGFSFVIGLQTREITGEERAEAVVLENGQELRSDLVLVSAGVIPDIVLAQKAGAATGRGIMVNDRMETSLPDIYAAGDATEHLRSCYGLWPVAERQGLVAGRNMAGGDELFMPATPSSVLKVAGLELFSAGDIDPDDKRESAVFTDPENYIYKKLVFDGSMLCGAILYGDLHDRQKLLRAIEDRTDLGSIKDDLVRGDLTGL